MCTTKFFVGFIFSTNWRVAQLFSKSYRWDYFFRNGFQLHGPRGYFWDPISDLIFLVRVIFYRDFFCKIEGDFNFVVNLFFWSDSFLRQFSYKIEVDFVFLKILNNLRENKKSFVVRKYWGMFAVHFNYKHFLSRGYFCGGILRLDFFLSGWTLIFCTK